MRINKNQREGIAKVADKLASACMVVAIVSGFVDDKIDWSMVTVLALLFVVLVVVVAVLRTEVDDTGK